MIIRQRYQVIGHVFPSKPLYLTQFVFFLSPHLAHSNLVADDLDWLLADYAVAEKRKFRSNYSRVWEMRARWLNLL